MIASSLFDKMKIRDKLFLSNVALILILVVTSVLAFNHVMGVYDQLLYESAEKQLNQSTEAIENELQKMEAYSYNLLADKGVQDSLVAIRDASSSFVAIKQAESLLKEVLMYISSEKYMPSAYFVDTQDYVYVDGSNPISINTKYKYEMIKMFIKGNGNFVIYDMSADEGYIFGGRQMRETNGLSLDYLGIIAFRLELSKLVERFLDSGDYLSSDLVILSEETVLYRSFEMDDHRLDAIIDGKSHGHIVIDIDNEPYFVAFSKSDYSGWTYVNFIPYELVFEGKEMLRRTLIVVLVIILILALVPSIFLSRNISKPLQSLTARMKRVESGDFSPLAVPFEYSHRKDEVGYLYKDFEIMIGRIGTLIDENYRKQLVIKDTSLKALQSQINPHFLYNTLESINWLAKSKKENEISSMAASLGKLMRNAVDTEVMLIPISQELELLEAYITIQKYRFEERLVFVNKIRTMYKQFLIPKLTLQPIIENAIKHGLENMLEPCYIIINADVVEHNLLITIKDNGPGMALEVVESINNNQKVQSQKGLGIGIENIIQRIQMLFGEAYGLHVESETIEGTVVTIKIPVVKED